VRKNPSAVLDRGGGRTLEHGQQRVKDDSCEGWVAGVYRWELRAKEGKARGELSSFHSRARNQKSRGGGGSSFVKERGLCIFLAGLLVG